MNRFFTFLGSLLLCSSFSQSQTVDLLKDIELNKTIHYSYDSENIWLSDGVRRSFSGSVLISVDSIVFSEEDSSRKYYLNYREIGNEILENLDGSKISQDIDSVYKKQITEFLNQNHKSGHNRLVGWLIPDSSFNFQGCEGSSEDSTIYYNYPHYYRYYSFSATDTLYFQSDTLVLKDAWTDCFDFGQSFEFKISLQHGLFEYSYKEHNFFGPEESKIFRKSQVTSINSKSNLNLVHNLFGNYPNPFNPSTIIKYNIGISGIVKIDVYDLLGRNIKTLVNEYKRPGSYEVTLYSQDLSSGVYIYTLKIGSFKTSKKMILLR